LTATSDRIAQNLEFPIWKGDRNNKNAVNMMETLLGVAHQERTEDCLKLWLLPWYEPIIQQVHYDVAR
jgi:hypothetical protein